MDEIDLEFLEREYDLGWFDRVLINMFSCGPLPKHIAIIMDGNRRFAREKNNKINQGYVEGGKVLFRLMYWFRNLGIKELSVFAFSVENFKRPIEEVDFLLQTFIKGARKVLSLQHEFESEEEVGNLNVNFFGKIELFDEEMQQVIRDCEALNKPNAMYSLNICLGYTSRFEVAQSVDLLTKFVIQNNFYPENITDEMIEETFYTNKSLPPELLIRTSGEIRFSDFMMPQLSYSFLRFINKNWPEVRGFDLIKYIAIYQYNVCYNQLSQTLAKFMTFKQTITCGLRKFCQNQRKDKPLKQKTLPLFEH